MSEYLTGIGWDVHRLVAGWAADTRRHHSSQRALKPGRTTDVDVFAHAITDAPLGAAALGDIGMHFPDTDPRWKDCDSLVFLRHARELAEGLGYRVANVDSTVILERLPLQDYRESIRKRLAETLSVELDRVSVKFKTAEKERPGSG